MKASGIKVLVIPHDFDNSFIRVSGIFFKDYVRALSKVGLDVSVMSVNLIGLSSVLKNLRLPSGLKKYILDGINVTRFEMPVIIPRLTYVNQRFRYYFGKKVFKKHVKINGLPDIVHVHVSDTGLLPVWIKSKYNIPFIITEHSSRFSSPDHSKSYYKNALKIFNESSMNIAVSKTLAVLLENKFNRPFSFIPNIIDVDFYKPKERESTKITYTFINIATFITGKNQLMLIDSFARTFGRNENYQLKIAGFGLLKSELEKRVKKHNLEDRILIFDQQSREGVKKLLNDSDCFVLSSLYETFGVVLIEALSCGLPVVATRCGGPESIVVNEDLGILCDIDADSIGKAMKQVTERKYNSNIIRQYVLDNYSDEVIGNNYLSIYKSIISQNQ